MAKTKQKSVQPEKMTDSNDHLIRSIIGQFNLVMARPDQVKKDCDKLRLLCQEPLPKSTISDLEPLFPMLQKRSGPIAEHLFTFLEETAVKGPDPLPFTKAMLSARDKNLALRAIKYAVRLAEKGAQVTLVNRKGKIEQKLPEQVEIVAGDATDSSIVHQICKEADAVFHCAMPPLQSGLINFHH